MEVVSYFRVEGIVRAGACGGRLGAVGISLCAGGVHAVRIFLFHVNLTVLSR